MRKTPESHFESALYWSAISMIVCEGIPVSEAARRLGVDQERLVGIVRARTAMTSEYGQQDQRSVSAIW